MVLEADEDPVRSRVEWDGSPAEDEDAECLGLVGLDRRGHAGAGWR